MERRSKCHFHGDVRGDNRVKEYNCETKYNNDGTEENNDDIEEEERIEREELRGRTIEIK